MPTKIEDLSVLLVENHANMRTQLRNMLASCGIVRVQVTVSAGAAVRKLHDNTFDIILCEYHLGDGQDGQHFLEDIRNHHLIPLSTIFIMVTGERSYERVVSAAELAPNDYILKPFALDRLQERLERALMKRDAFLPTYDLIESGNVQDAIVSCEEGELAFPQYTIDFLRLRAELLLSTGRPDEAQEVYKKVLERKAVPWAKLGLAKSMYMMKQFETAATQLSALIEENSNYIDAYDWLAKTREAIGQLKDARVALEAASKLSPHVLHRLRRIGEVSIELGDLEAAEKTLSEVVRQSKYSDFRDPEDHVKLVKAQLGVGAADRASATLRDLERNMQGLPKTDVCKALSAAMVHTHLGEEEKAVAAAEKAATLLDPRLGISTALKKDLAKVCIDHNMGERAAEVAMDIMRNAADETAVDGVRAMLTNMGQGQLGDSLATQLKREVHDMMAEGAAMAQKGDFEGAVKHMVSAARRMPGNNMVLYNAALALLKYIEHCGWDDHYAEHARSLIERLRVQDPTNPKLGPLHVYFDGLLRRYGVRAEQA